MRLQYKKFELNKKIFTQNETLEGAKALFAHIFTRYHEEY